MGIGDQLLMLKLIDVAQKRRIDQHIKDIRHRVPTSKAACYGVCAGEVVSGVQARVDELLSKRDAAWSEPSFRQALHLLHEGDAILFIGAGFCLGDGATPRSRHGLRGQDVARELLEALPTESRKVFERAPLDVLASEVERTRDRPFLISRLEELCARTIPKDPLAQHRILARAPQVKWIVTTNWDRLIEQAFAEDSLRRLQSVTHGSSILSIDRKDAVLFKVHGDFDGQKFVVEPRITSDDIERLRDADELMFHYLETLFGTYSVIAIGFQPEDPNFRQLSRFMRKNTKRQQIFVVDPYRSLPLNGAQLVRSTATEFFEAFQAYSACGGGRVGLHYGSPSKRLGAVSQWAGDLCVLAREIGTKYPHVERVDVVQSRAGDESEAVRHSVGKRAATVLRESVNPGYGVALSCGSTLRSLVDEASATWENFSRVRLYSTGFPAFDNSSVAAPSALVTLLSQRLAKLGVSARTYHVPPAAFELLLDDDLRAFAELDGKPSDGSLRRMVEAWVDEVSGADVFFLGVGALGVESGFQEFARSCFDELDHRDRDAEERFPRYIEQLQRGDLDYIGDVAYHLFRNIPRGTPSEQAMSRFMTKEGLIRCFGQKAQLSRPFRQFLLRLYSQVISVPVDALMRASKDPNRTVALIASGERKAEAIDSLLNAGIGDTLVLDRILAEKLVDA